MPKKSAGLLLYRNIGGRLEVMLVHLGGPLWAGKDVGIWSIPKGEFQPPEEPLSTAKRDLRKKQAWYPATSLSLLSL